ncbi:hypothetical protein [Pseudonocardia phyllosphaerae]|uniref:hypothetical protein n=1 Tax=Pseudonocardia phyllosphaerae TaxID=3390502 RepID=UPI00397DDBB7
MTDEGELVNAVLRRKRTVELAQRIHAAHRAEVEELRTVLHWYPDPETAGRRIEVSVAGGEQDAELQLVASADPDAETPPGLGIWRLAVAAHHRTSGSAVALGKGEGDGWARAVFGYECAPLVYRRSDGGSRLFRRPAVAEHYVVYHGEYGPVHPSDVASVSAKARTRGTRAETTERPTSF